MNVLKYFLCDYFTVVCCLLFLEIPDMGENANISEARKIQQLI